MGAGVWAEPVGGENCVTLFDLFALDVFVTKSVHIRSFGEENAVYFTQGLSVPR
jgi:hypothetical protein